MFALVANDAVVALAENDAVVEYDEVTDVEANDADAIEPDIVMVPVVAKLPDIFILPEKLTAILFYFIFIIKVLPRFITYFTFVYHIFISFIFH